VTFNVVVWNKKGTLLFIVIKVLPHPSHPL
jgi:hypothetical protein